VVINSNNEKELPDAFLRRCFFHYIRFPDTETMKAIVEVAFPRHQAAPRFRGAQDLLRDPRSAGHEEEAIDLGIARLLKLLLVEEMTPEMLRERDPKKLIPPLHGALLKNEQDVHLFERLAFLARRDGSR